MDDKAALRIAQSNQKVQKQKSGNTDKNAYNGQNIPDKEVSVDVKCNGCKSSNDDDNFCQIPVRFEVFEPTSLQLQQLLANKVDDEDDKSGKKNHCPLCVLPIGRFNI